MYETDISSVCIDFGKGDVYFIQPKPVQFPLKYGHSTAERKILPITLCWACIVHKCKAVPTTMSLSI